MSGRGKSARQVPHSEGQKRRKTQTLRKFCSSPNLSPIQVSVLGLGQVRPMKIKDPPPHTHTHSPLPSIPMLLTLRHPRLLKKLGHWRSLAVESYIHFLVFCLSYFISLTDTFIWFIGDSLLSHLEDDLGALCTPSNLGLADSILWLVKRGMHWSDLLPIFQYAMIFNSKPVLIVINVGGNELVTIKQGKFIWVIRPEFFIS